MNLNALVRTLAGITIALARPAIVAAPWGMNVSVLIENGEVAFVVLTVIVVALAIGYAERTKPRPGRRS